MAERASDIIDALTFRAVERFSLVEGNPLFTRVKKAVAYQCEFIQRTYGSLDAWENDGAEGEGSENIGNYSYSKKAPRRTTVNGLAVSPHINTVLAPVIAKARRLN
jgi:hypothetical protein